MIKSFACALILILSISSCGGNGEADSSSTELKGDIPELSRWESQMITYGRKVCDKIQNESPSSEVALADTYYDAEWVFYRIAAYTGDDSFKSCANSAEKIYRDNYVFPNKGGIPGYWIFTHGLVTDYQLTGDSSSKDAVILLSQAAAFAPDSTPLSETADASLSREVAYNIMSYLNAEIVGAQRRPRLSQLVDQALGHLNQWFVSKSAPYVRPFMVALTAQALIMYFESTGDPRIPPALETAADALWNNTWLPAQECFMYTDRNTDSGGQEPAPDLNLLIAPMYGWLYRNSGQQRFLERGNQIFAGGVKFAFLDGTKQFNQSYRWSFDYVNWVASAVSHKFSYPAGTSSRHSLAEARQRQKN